MPPPPPPPRPIPISLQSERPIFHRTSSLRGAPAKDLIYGSDFKLTFSSIHDQRKARPVAVLLTLRGAFPKSHTVQHTRHVGRLVTGESDVKRTTLKVEADGMLLFVRGAVSLFGECCNRQSVMVAITSSKMQSCSYLVAKEDLRLSRHQGSSVMAAMSSRTQSCDCHFVTEAVGVEILKWSLPHRQERRPAAVTSSGEQSRCYRQFVT